MSQCLIENVTEVEAEIIYMKQDGTMIHSDIEPRGCKPIFDDEYKQYLHACLEEWLTQGRGTGMFYIKNANFNLDDFGN